MTPAAAQSVEREELGVLGWNPSCGVAINHLGFPHRGDAIYDDPVFARIGVISIAAGQEKPRSEWDIAWDGAYSWKPELARKSLAELLAKGYDNRGYVEEIRVEAAAPQRELEETLRSTATLGVRVQPGWPPAPWRLSRIHYNRLSNCALVLFENEKKFSYALVRIYNTAARPTRARAHLNNGLLLFGRGDIEGALAETRIAAAMQPDDAVNRYHHAAMLSLSGELEKATAELSEAIKLKPDYREKAAKDQDFENLRDLKPFQALIEKEKK